MDETWRHGTLIGGMACRDLRQVARAYKLAADELLKQALEKYEPHELDYPVLFLYRHTVEVYLKAALDDPPEHHDLSRLIQLLEAESGKKILRRQTRLEAEAHTWVDFGPNQGGRCDGQDGMPTPANHLQGPVAAAAQLSRLRPADVAGLHQPPHSRHPRRLRPLAPGHPPLS